MSRHLLQPLAKVLRFLCFALIILKSSVTTAVSTEAKILEQKLAPSAVYAIGGAELANLRALYSQRQFQPIWTTHQSYPALLETALQVIAAADAEGLDSRDYQLPLLRQLQADQSPSAAIELEIRVTHSLLQLAHDLARGRLPIESTDPDWHIPRPEFDAVTFLHDAIASNRLQQAFEDLSPQKPNYRLLKKTLAYYRELARNNTQWVQIPASPSIHPGDTGTTVPLLRQRIAQAYIADGIAAYNLAFNQSQHYDLALVSAIQAFQKQHGLNADGVIGKNTVHALNTPLEWKIRQLRISMERLRWLPRNLGDRYLLVNTSGFILRAIEHDQQVLTMRIIVGRDYRSTPSFNSAVSHMVINPYWNVPASIARKDLLPKQLRNPDFFAASGFKVYPGHDRNAEAIDPGTIDWHKYEHGFPFFLRQQPGEHNALGKVKFMFDNPFSIYLHDTPSKSLFKRDMRTFSSGCIRLEKPLELAAFALNQSDLLEKFNENMANDETITMHLPKPLPIYLMYITAWVDEPQHRVHFYPDTYDRDLHALRYARW